jgi:hypothetical protein
MPECLFGGKRVRFRSSRLRPKLSASEGPGVQLRQLCAGVGH